MRVVHLLRHAKSAWDTGLPDHERPLAGRGRRAADAIARHLGEAGVVPDLVICSSARRARETLERIAPALDVSEVRVDRAIYGAGSPELLELLRAVPDEAGSVMLIGHNPGMQELALDLAAPGAALEDLRAKYPTAALATLAFAAPEWRALEPGTGELTAFVRPRELG